MKKIIFFFKEQFKEKPVECIASIFCLVISLFLVVAFVLGVFGIIASKEKTLALQITILQTTLAIIAFGGAIVAFIGWKELKQKAEAIAKETAANYYQNLQQSFDPSTMPDEELLNIFDVPSNTDDFLKEDTANIDK